MHDYSFWADLLSKFHTSDDFIKFAMLFSMVATISITWWFIYKIITKTTSIVITKNQATYTPLSSHINDISETAYYKITYPSLNFKARARGYDAS